MNELYKNNTKQISEAVHEPIKIVVGETQLQQQFLADANSRTSDKFHFYLFVIF